MSCASANNCSVHEKLVKQKGILHWDVSPNNMVFRCSKNGDRPVLLIDFNYAVCLDYITAQYPKVSTKHYC